ncbi:MAG: hypothetical protein IKR39_12555 [Lachnospiraceae bacterium]|nr:hypothetical protein [Lachnospiraceae bacterium]
MSRRDFNKDLFSNIEITQDIKNEIYENCRRGQRTSDLRFRYSGVITALIVILIFGCTGAGSYAYYRSVQSRMEAMQPEEIKEYALDLDNDTSVTIDGAYSRRLTDEESLRVAELERKYNAEGEFPEGEVKRVATLAEWDGESVCYVEEDHKLHLPDKMTDEQLLLFIDYQTKKDYVMKQEVEEMWEEEGVDTPSPYVDVENITEAELIEMSREPLEKLFGKGTIEGWEPVVQAFKPSAAYPEDGTDHDMYNVIWNQAGGSSYSTDYIVVFNMNDLSLIGVAVRGKEHWAGLKSFTDAEAAAKVETDLPKVCAEIERLYGYKNYDSERHEVYYDYTDPGENDARQTRYVFTFGNKTVDVMWDLGDEKLASVEFFDE